MPGRAGEKKQVSLDRKEIIFRYLDMPREKRMPLPAFRKQIRISPTKFREVRQEWELNKNKRVTDETYDSIQYLKGRTRQMDIALISSALGGNAHNQKLFRQLIEQLVEKQEVTHKIDGSFFARAAREAEAELRADKSMEGILENKKELSLLPPELCLHSGQE